MSATRSGRTSTLARYPKRKRTLVISYNDDEVTSEEEENENTQELPLPKRRKPISDRPLPTRKIFPFLQLPAELRNQIYSYCLTDPAGIYLRSTTKRFRRTVDRTSEHDLRGPLLLPLGHNSGGDNGERKETSQRAKPLVPTLLAVCKQINAEARDILYDHVFYMDDAHTMHSFIVNLGPRAAKFIKDVRLESWGTGRRSAYHHVVFTALSMATNLERFTFHVRNGWWGVDPKNCAIRFYRDAFQWLEAVGAAKGKADAALDLIEMSGVDSVTILGFKSVLGNLLLERQNMFRS